LRVRSPSLEPIRRTKAYVLAAEQIRARIIDGTWSVSDRLPSEKELGEQLGIGRGSVREALRILEALGWIQSRPGEGARVAERASARVMTPIADVVPPQRVDLADLWETRKIIEPPAAYLAAERCEPTALDAIEDILNRMAALTHAGELVQALRLNPDFHLAVGRASGNEVLARIQEQLAQLERAAVVSEGEPDSTLARTEKVLTEHRVILDAIRANKPAEAQQAMFQHLLDSWMAKWRSA
jgi:GntR family transcriptional repressor for pyruvate dehydrogenase complex